MQLARNVRNKKEIFNKCIRQSEEDHENALSTLSKKGKPGMENVKKHWISFWLCQNIWLLPDNSTTATDTMVY